MPPTRGPRHERQRKAKSEPTAGKVEKEAGRAVGNESAAAEGSAKESKGDLRGAKEKAKDALKD
ncbi:CsbD family protein [Streptomyces decoyicus]|uniref:CsbD family protein n=1 Tax=Streptomyces decoyicus TaxID=249567 RepID=UPI0036361A76